MIVPFAGNEVPLLVSRALPAPVPLPLSTLKVVSSRNNNNNPVVVIKNRFPRKTMQSVEMMEKKKDTMQISVLAKSLSPPLVEFCSYLHWPLMSSPLVLLKRPLETPLCNEHGFESRWQTLCRTQTLLMDDRFRKFNHVIFLAANLSALEGFASPGC